MSVSSCVGVAFQCPAPYREAMQVAAFIRKTGKRQTTRFAGHIEIGQQMKIPCKIFIKVCLLLCMKHGDAGMVTLLW